MSLHHKLCHVLGGTFNLPHAETHTVILPHAVAYNEPAEPAIMRSIAETIGMKSPSLGLYQLSGQLGAKRSLRELGMPETGIEKGGVTSHPEPLLESAPTGTRADTGIDPQSLGGRSAGAISSPHEEWGNYRVSIGWVGLPYRGV